MTDDDAAREPVAILLVEDEPADAELCLRSLGRQGLTSGIAWVKDGAEALEFLRAKGRYTGRRRDELPRVVFLDLKLPRIDGFEVLQRIRADEVLRTVPVVVLSSSAEERDVVECYRLGANSFVTKPVDFARFQQVIGELGSYWLLVNRQPAGLAVPGGKAAARA